jgi:hypothetical protein
MQLCFCPRDQTIRQGPHLTHAKSTRYLLPTLPCALPSTTHINGGFSNVSDNEGKKYGDSNANPRYHVEPKVYPQRWMQLAYLSLLALLLDWICFSIAASPDGFEAAYPRASAAHLIDIFLLTNMASCFLVTDVVARFWMEASIKDAMSIMTMG